jgi:LPXTG-motif cell wall-anchored protein
MKLSARLSAAAAIVGATVLIVAAPAVAAPWVGNYVIGGTDWQLRDSASGIGHTYDEAHFLSSVSHRFGALYIDGSYAWCDTATANLDTDAGTGDLIATCDAQEITPGIFVTVNYRLYSAGDLARMFYTIENRTGADITASDFYLFDDYDDYGVFASSTGLTTGVLSSDDKWVITAASAGTTVAGSFWALPGNTASTSSGDISVSEETFHDFVNTTFAAGSTTYVADFVTIHLPLAPFDPSDTTVAFDAAVAAASEFDTFSGRLVAGLPEGITVLNWGETTPAAPALANTGIDASASIAAAGGAMLLLVGGAGLMITRRRRITA